MKRDGRLFCILLKRSTLPFIAQLDRFRTSDLIGGPHTYDYGEYGAFSPTTLHYVQIAGMIQEKMSIQQPGARLVYNSPCRRVIQIGAGYGGLCKILHDLSLWDSYAIVDLPEHLELARKVLAKEGIAHVSVLHARSDSKPRAIRSGCERFEFFRIFSSAAKDLHGPHFIACARRIILGHVFPKHFGVEPFTLDEMKRLFGKKETCSIRDASNQGRKGQLLFFME